MSNGLFISVKDYFMPPRCAVCGDIIVKSQSRAMCFCCFEKYNTELNKKCPVCARQYDSCICVPKDFLPDSFAYSLPYDSTGDGSIRKLILCCKNRRHKAVIEEFTDKMLQSAKKRSIIKEDVLVTYVPRSPEKTVRIGTDQARELAESISKRLGAVCLPLIERISGGSDQKLLSRAERRENARLHYIINPRFEKMIYGANILLIDDVVTTGSSVNSCTELLRLSGASEVACLAAAKSIRSRYEYDQHMAELEAQTQE